MSEQYYKEETGRLNRKLVNQDNNIENLKDKARKARAKIKNLESVNVGLLEACKMVTDSIYQDSDGEWFLNRPVELLKTISDEAIAKAEGTDND